MKTPLEEKLELCEKLTEVFKKDESFLEQVKGLIWPDQGEPTPAKALKCAESYIQTQRGLTQGSFTGPVGILEVTISWKVIKEKGTT